jgi:hypothetical protein
MKYYLFLMVVVLLYNTADAQKLNSGTYIFKYCDLEYNRCLSTCKVVIKKDGITIYATKELAKAITDTKEGDIIDKGIILRHKTGKWIIGKSR